jgi:cytochrome c oxidase assembly factor CtaG
MNQDKLNMVVKIIIKYLLQGFAVAIAAYYIPVMFKTSLRKPTIQEITSIGLTASLTMLVLDFVSGDIGIAVKFGSGFTIGQNLVKLI